MKIAIFSFIVLVLSICSYGQSTNGFKDGGYMNVTEFKNQTPAFKDTFQLITRSKGDIKFSGGNDYKFSSNNESIDGRTLRKEIWGICVNDTLYLNGIPITGLTGYAKVEVFGKYCFLRAAFPVNSKIQKELGVTSNQMGYMFGAIGGAIQGAQMAVKRVPLIYNITTGQKMLLNRFNIKKIIEKYSDLDSEFEAEANLKDENVLLKYLVKINELDHEL